MQHVFWLMAAYSTLTTSPHCWFPFLLKLTWVLIYKLEWRRARLWGGSCARTTEPKDSSRLLAWATAHVPLMWISTAGSWYEKDRNQSMFKCACVLMSSGSSIRRKERFSNNLTFPLQAVLDWFDGSGQSDATEKVQRLNLATTCKREKVRLKLESCYLQLQGTCRFCRRDP